MDRLNIETRRPVRRVRSAVQLALLIATTLLLAACGGDSDDSTEETSTEVVEDAGGVVLGTPEEVAQPGLPSGSPVVASSPVTESDTTAVASPASLPATPAVLVPTATADVIVATPNADVPVAGASPTPSEDADTTATDGTGGEPAVDEDANVDTGALTDSLSGVLGSTTDACVYEDYPPYTGSLAEQVTTSEVNFRPGPGADCEPVIEVLAEGTTVIVLSQPVQREGDTDNLWIAVSVDGAEGWIVAAALLPAE